MMGSEFGQNQPKGAAAANVGGAIPAMVFAKVVHTREGFNEWGKGPTGPHLGVQWGLRLRARPEGSNRLR